MRVLHICLLALILPATVVADIPPLPEVEFTSDAVVPVVLVVTPDGQGTAPTEAMAYGFGGVVDATLRVTIYDWNMDPVVNYPHEDIWVQTTMDGMTFCPGGNVADTDTDVFGSTTFTLPFFGGGASDAVVGEELELYVNGSPVLTSTLPVYLLSPDLDGNLEVNLSDVILFAGSYLSGVYDFAIDFQHDGTLNLSDLIIFVRYLNSNCP